MAKRRSPKPHFRVRILAPPQKFAHIAAFCYDKRVITATIQKLKRELKRELKQELIKEFVAPLLKGIKDPEGEYRPEFVKRILKAEKEKPKYRFDSKTFWKALS